MEMPTPKLCGNLTCHNLTRVLTLYLRVCISCSCQDALQSVCFHPNGDLLAVATQNNKFRVLDANTGDESFSCEIGSEQHDCIKYSPGVLLQEYCVWILNVT